MGDDGRGGPDGLRGFHKASMIRATKTALNEALSDRSLDDIDDMPRLGVERARPLNVLLKPLSVLGAHSPFASRAARAA